MSMSQEEIEALMNGLDISDDDNTSEENASEEANLNTDEIEALISQADEVKIEEPETVEDNSVSLSNEDIENLINETSSEPIMDNEAIDNLLNEVSSEPVSNDDIDDLLKDLESDSSESSDDISIANFDDILADVDGIVESSSDTVNVSSPDVVLNINEDEIVKNWTDSKINEGIFPLPAEKDTKVVNQLSQVANDSEEKVSQIFDVLSLGLDNNNEFRTKINEFDSFLSEQTNLLTSLNSKFPNINVFKGHLEKANSMKINLDSLKNTMNEEDMKIFEAMELMQFNDINRQKIERVMAVIRKLSLYLNNLFEDGEGYQDVAVARHIHGDDTHDLIGDDLDKLIEEFGKK